MAFAGIGYFATLIKILTYGFVIVCIIAGVYWYLLKKKHRSWIVRIYEADQSGLPDKKNKRGEIVKSNPDVHRLRLVGKDRIIEKRDQNGAPRYILEKNKKLVMPPSYENIESYRGKEYVDMLRKEDEYTYMMKSITKGEILRHNVMDYNTKHLMTLNIEERKKRYAKKQDFLQKWGHFIAIAMIMLMVIVAMVLTFDFITSTVKSIGEKQDQQLGLMERMVDALKDKTGGGSAPNEAPNIQ